MDRPACVLWYLQGSSGIAESYHRIMIPMRHAIVHPLPGSLGRDDNLSGYVVKRARSDTAHRSRLIHLPSPRPHHHLLLVHAVQIPELPPCTCTHSHTDDTLIFDEPTWSGQGPSYDLLLCFAKPDGRWILCKLLVVKGEQEGALVRGRWPRTAWSFCNALRTSHCRLSSWALCSLLLFLSS